ncbi:DUF2520 domain-containing protein [candidate division WOR-3 bacterium]|jgi:hypothetical protein|nr:DUF2520 domain-containing protein [candidate division WOR-3 bacterium]
MKYGIIGAGNVGLTIGYYLYKNNISVKIFTRNIKTKKEYYSSMPENIFTENFNSFIDSLDYVFLAIPEYSIDNIVQKIIGRSGIPIILFSGSYKPKRNNVFTLHPAASFPCPILDVGFIEKIVFTSEQSKTIKHIEKELHINVVTIRNRNILYHTAAMIASNFITILLFAANNIMKKFTINDEDSNIILKSLSSTSLEAYFKFHKFTGPVEREDHNLIKQYFKALKGSNELNIFKSIIEYSRILKNEKK